MRCGENDVACCKMTETWSMSHESHFQPHISQQIYTCQLHCHHLPCSCQEIIRDVSPSFWYRKNYSFIVQNLSTNQKWVSIAGKHKLTIYGHNTKDNKIWLAFISSSEKNNKFSLIESCYLSVGNFGTICIWFIDFGSQFIS